MTFVKKASLLAASLILSSLAHAQVTSRNAVCDKLNECRPNFDNNSCKLAQQFFDFAATQPVAQCGPVLTANEALFSCIAALSCVELDDMTPDCVNENAAVDALDPAVTDFCLVNIAIPPPPPMPPTPPAGWTCNPAFFGSDDGCDCGCGAADTDCADATFASCLFSNCIGATGEVVIATPTTCAAATCGNGSLAATEQCDGGPDCSATCELPAASPLVCNLQGVCHTPFTCGDRFVDANQAQQEQCDDGNTAAGDGCAADCTIEPGFKCEDAPSARPPSATTASSKALRRAKTATRRAAMAVHRCVSRSRALRASSLAVHAVRRCAATTTLKATRNVTTATPAATVALRTARWSPALRALTTTLRASRRCAATVSSIRTRPATTATPQQAMVAMPLATLSRHRTLGFAPIPSTEPAMAATVAVV
jgi:cysteine-rich repeat protein